MEGAKEMKKPVIVLIAILAVIAVISLAKDLIIKTTVEKGVEIVTGLPLKMQSFKVGVIRTLVGIKGLKVYNPKGFEDKVMLSMPEVLVDYNLSSIIGGKIHLSNMKINMEEFVVVKNAAGKVNLDSLKTVEGQKKGKTAQEVKKEDKAAGAPDIQIDSLQLKIGRLVYKDYSKGGAPSVTEYNIDIDEKYENITSPQSLITLILVKSLAGTKIANLANIDIRAMQGDIKDSLASATKVLNETSTKMRAAIKEGADTKKLEATAKEAAESLKDTAKDLKETFKMPFGGKEE